MARTSLRDVAKAAGVSSMAVSTVLHGTGTNVRVAPETAERIRKAALELNYQPNALARSLRHGKTKTIGVVFQHFGRLTEQNPYYPMLLNGIMAALFPADYTLALCPKLVQGGNIGAMLDGRFDGVLWTRPDFTEANLETIRNSRVPMVLLHAPPGSVERVPHFCCDNDTDMDLVARHFKQLGHRAFAFLIEALESRTAEGSYRCDAAQRAAERHGLGYELIRFDSEAPLKAQIGAHTAVSCFSDTAAFAVLEKAKEEGIRVPEDLSVVGFDSSPFCERLDPPLTSVYQPVEMIAKEATEQLLKEIDSPTPPELIHARLYPGRLDVRASTGPPRA